MRPCLPLSGETRRSVTSKSTLRPSSVAVAEELILDSDVGLLSPRRAMTVFGIAVIGIAGRGGAPLHRRLPMTDVSARRVPGDEAVGRPAVVHGGVAGVAAERTLPLDPVALGLGCADAAVAVVVACGGGGNGAEDGKHNGRRKRHQGFLAVHGNLLLLRACLCAPRNLLLLRACLLRASQRDSQDFGVDNDRNR